MNMVDTSGWVFSLRKRWHTPNEVLPTVHAVPSEGGSSTTRAPRPGLRLAEMPTWCAVVLVCCLIYLAFVIWAQARFHSDRFALDYVMGARLQVEPSPLLLGPHRVDEQFDAAIRLRNHGGKPVTILGAMVACPCVASRGLPRTIAAGEAVVMPISVRVGAIPGEWRQAVRYLTDLPGQSDVVVELRSEVIAAPPARGPTRAIR